MKLLRGLILGSRVDFSDYCIYKAAMSGNPSEKVDLKDLAYIMRNHPAPEEFDFKGLKAANRFYTETDGKRVINDLEVVK